MKASISFPSTSPSHSWIPVANFGITVKCFFRLSLMISHSLSLSSNVLTSFTFLKVSKAL